MKTHVKNGQQLYRITDISERLEALVSNPGASRFAILADALQAWLTGRGEQELDDGFGLRLDRISTQLGRMEPEQQIVMESSPALFIRYFLTINAAQPEADQAARAVGRDRFQASIDQVGRNIASGSRSLGRAETLNGQGEKTP